MRVIAFADPTADLGQLTSALEETGVALEVEPDDVGAAAEGPAAETAAALIASERVLIERPPAAVLLAGGSNRVLAAGLTASKLEIPLVSLATEAAANGADGERNSRLLGLLADLVVAAGETDPGGTIHAWLETASRDSGIRPANG